MQQTQSYQCRVLHGEYDPAHPEANTQVVGTHAESGEQAARAISAATGGRVIDTWRQDRTPERLVFSDNVVPVHSDRWDRQCPQCEVIYGPGDGTRECGACGFIGEFVPAPQPLDD